LGGVLDIFSWYFGQFSEGKHKGTIEENNVLIILFDTTIFVIRCVGVIRNAKCSPRVWELLKFTGTTTRNTQGQRRKIKAIEGLISYFIFFIGFLIIITRCISLTEGTS